MIARALAVELLRLQAEYPDDPLEVVVAAPYDDEGEPEESFPVTRVEIREYPNTLMPVYNGRKAEFRTVTFREIVLRSYD